jgi:hypothetical protein
LYLVVIALNLSSFEVMRLLMMPEVLMSLVPLFEWWSDLPWPKDVGFDFSL